MYIPPVKSNSRLALSSSKGFTLVEALVTLVVLTVALGPSLVLTTTINNTTLIVKNNLIAANLAQEGVEVIRGIRDTNWFNGVAFDTGLTDGIYRIEWSSDAVIALGANPFIREDSGLYNYSAGNNTIFRRTISILKVNTGELRIISEVTWQERGAIAKNSIAESHLFNWK